MRTRRSPQETSAQSVFLSQVWTGSSRGERSSSSPPWDGSIGHGSPWTLRTGSQLRVTHCFLVSRLISPKNSFLDTNCAHIPCIPAVFTLHLQRKRKKRLLFIAHDHFWFHNPRGQILLRGLRSGRRHVFYSLTSFRGRETKATPWSHFKGHREVNFKGKNPSSTDANGMSSNGFLLEITFCRYRTASVV